MYLQDQIKLGERWVFTLGGRHDWSDLRTDDLLAGTNTSQRDSAFTGRVGVVYLGPFGLSPYMSYSTSFNPTIGTDRNNQPFKPTKGKQIEVGIKFAPSSKTSITAAVFQIHQTNVLTPDLNDPTGMHNAQSGEIRSQGIELEGTTQLLPGWNVIASYTYQDVRNTKANDVTLNKWPIAIPIPRQMASLWTDYRIRSGVLQGVGIGAGVLLPSATVFLLLLCNDKAVLGPWTNGRAMNIFTGGVVAVLVMLSVILTAAVLFPGIGEFEIGAILISGSLIAVVMSLVLWRIERRSQQLHRPHHPQRVSVLDRDRWTMPPLEQLTPARWTPLKRTWMFVLRGYLVVAAGLVLVRIAGLLTG